MFLKCWDLEYLKKFPRKPLKQSYVTIEHFLTAALQTLHFAQHFYFCFVAYKPVAY